MKRKTRYKSAPLNILVAVICLSVCAGSLYFFFKDLNSSSFRTDKDAIATITFKYKIAQRKFNDRVVWERLQQDSPLYDGDTVRTANMAQATIRFKEGASIEINENTMVQIALSENGDVKLAINDGHIEIDTTNSEKSVALDMGTGVTVNLESGSKLAAKLDESKTGVGLNMKAGNAQITMAENATDNAGGAASGNAGTVSVSNLSAGESVKVSENGDIKKAPITVTSVSETQKILVFDNEKKNTSVPLEWFPLENKTDKVIVQTSPKKDFSVLTKSFSVDATNKVDIPAEDGPVYWRVFPENAPETSVEGKILFESVPKIVTTSPEIGETYNYYNEKPSVQFSWRGNNYSSKYRLEIGKTASLENPVFTKELASQNFSVADLDDGTYFWRVVPFYDTNGIGWYSETDVKSFTISKREKLLSPSLVIPPDGRKITYTNEAFNVDFSWKSENVKSEFTLQISRDENFSNVLFNSETKTKSLHRSFSVSDFPDGEYFWRILQNASVSDSENVNLVSPTRKFSVAKYVPEQNRLLYPDDSYSLETANLSSLNFMWKISAENEKIYANERTRVQFSTSEDFSNVVLEEATNGTSLKNVRLNPGKYFWRIVKGESTTTPRAIFLVDRLASPTVISPKTGAKLLLNKGQSLTASWKNVSDADFYKVKLLDASTNKVLADIPETTAETLTIPLESLSERERKFTLQIQAVTNETKLNPVRRSEISESQFSVRLPTMLSLVSPKQNARIDGLSALRNGVDLNWKRGDETYSTSTLKLWRVGVGGQLSLIESYPNPRETVNLPKLSEGTYRWTVSAQTSDGISLDSGETRDFVVDAIPLLDSPALDSPAKGQKIDGVYLKKNRSITFSWNPVQNATDYTFVLYQKLPTGNLRQVYSSENQKTTQVKLKNLTILDIGTFQWQVTAQNRAKDGFVYQNGKTASQEFSIDFSSAKKVEIKTPSELYGE